MTNSTPHRATPEQWADAGAFASDTRACLIELRDRLAAAEQRISELDPWRLVGQHLPLLTSSGATGGCVVMAHIEHFQARSLRVEAQRQETGWHFYAWRPSASQFFTDSASLLRWAKWPTKTPTGDALRQWIVALESAPADAPDVDPTAATRMVT